MIDVDTASFFAIVFAAAIAAALAFPFVGPALRRHEEADREPHIEEDPDGGSPPLGEEPAIRPAPAA